MPPFQHEIDDQSYEPDFAKKPKLRVRFSETLQEIRSIPHRYEAYSNEEKQICFYTGEDMARMSSETRALVKHLGKHLEMHEGHDLTTGLERRSRAGLTQYRSNIAQGVRAVMTEQTIQRVMKQPDDEMMRFVYKSISQSCSKLAEIRALKTAADAAGYPIVTVSGLEIEVLYNCWPLDKGKKTLFSVINSGVMRIPRTSLLAYGSGSAPSRMWSWTIRLQCHKTRGKRQLVTKASIKIIVVCIQCKFQSLRLPTARQQWW